MIWRREFITLLGGAAVWPLAARAQQSDRMRRIGVLVAVAADDPEGQARIAAFREALQQLGWTHGRNAQIEIRWSAGSDETRRRHAAELIALAPDIILASGGSVVGVLLQATRSVPVVFTLTPDPVGAGFARVCRNRAGMRPVSRDSSTVSVRNGWSCSRRSRRA